MDEVGTINRIKQDEGCILYAYDDHLGYLTIGYGRLIDGRKGGGISRAEAAMLLANDVKRAEAVARKYDWYESLDPVRQGVIVCMCFQLGSVDKFPRMRSALAALDYNMAAVEMLDSRWATQTPARAKRLAFTMRTGQWSP